MTTTALAIATAVQRFIFVFSGGMSTSCRPSGRSSIGRASARLSDVKSAVVQAGSVARSASRVRRTKKTRSSGVEDRDTLVFELLNKRLGPEFLSERPGNGGHKFTYIEAHKVVSIANAIFGSDGWSSEVISLDKMSEDKDGNDFMVTFQCIVAVTVLWAGGQPTTHQDVGYGNGKSRRQSEAIESAGKEAVTDALKRAFRLFGNALGNCLYDKEFLQWVKKRKQGLQVLDSQWSDEDLLGFLGRGDVAYEEVGSSKQTKVEERVGNGKFLVSRKLYWC